jgi:hypothetical protein
MIRGRGGQQARSSAEREQLRLFLPPVYQTQDLGERLDSTPRSMARTRIVVPLKHSADAKKKGCLNHRFRRVECERFYTKAVVDGPYVAFMGIP